jgi:hypothetical protein
LLVSTLYLTGGGTGKEIGRDLLRDVREGYEETRNQELLCNGHEQISSKTLQSNEAQREVQIDVHINLAREKRERSAAKANDAEVPEYLWMEHCLMTVLGIGAQRQGSKS